VTKEFSDAAHEYLQEIEGSLTKYRFGALTAAIVLKEKEVEHLSGLLSGGNYFPPMMATIKKVFDLNSEKFKVAVISNDGIAGPELVCLTRLCQNSRPPPRRPPPLLHPHPHP
jgi:hypothetical protein